MLLLCTLLGLLAVSNAGGFYHYPRNLENFFHSVGMHPMVFPEPVQNRSASVAPNYTFTEWSDFSACSKVCGGGKMEKTRQCLNDRGETVAITKCTKVMARELTPLQLLRRYLAGSGLKTEIEQKLCNTQKCNTSEWNDWGECDQACSGGIQYATRTCLDSVDQTKCVFQSLRRRPCNEFNCFRVEEWGEWGECSRKCSGGWKTRHRNCAPNLDSTNSEYKRLLAVKEQMEMPNVRRPFSTLVGLPPFSPDYHYISEYLTACGVKRESATLCNTQKCPNCPENQIYYHCKPCVRSCKPPSQVSLRSVFDFNWDFQHMFGFATGCGGICQEGCGCPFVKPFLGADNVCYMFQWQCPSPVISGRTGESSENQKTTATQSHTTVIPNTTVQSAETSAFTTEVTSTDPTIEERELFEGSTELTTTAGQQTSPMAKCDYGRMIATRPGVMPCVCDGELKKIPCYSNSDTSCPVICDRPTQNLVCPPVQRKLPVKKSGSSICEDQCADNRDCVVGDLCCSTACGRKCVIGVAPAEGDEE